MEKLRWIMIVFLILVVIQVQEIMAQESSSLFILASTNSNRIHQIDEQNNALDEKERTLQVAYIQERISGTVTDSQSGETLPGVNVMVKGTTTGTSTDAGGNFDLIVESLQDTLVFSFVGYQTQEMAIDGQTEINVALQSQAIAGEE